MKIEKNVSLSSHSTMGLGGNADYLCSVASNGDVAEAASWAKDHQLPIIMIGDGSNIIWQDNGFKGLVVINQILGYTTRQAEGKVILTIGAGEVWDKVVERSVAENLSGIEALSLIPGSSGATPIQNVGAYGQDIAQTLVSLEAYDTQDSKFVDIDSQDCGFGYRTSRFKTTDRGRFLIVSLTLSLTPSNPEPPFYASVQTYFDEHVVTDITAANLRQAVISIRKAKLPDPAIIKNCGSFFGNPLISQTDFNKLIEKFPDLPHWPAEEGIKVPAAWLIEQAGFKDYHDQSSGMATWPHQPLVLVNESARSTADLLNFKQKIVDAIQAEFGLILKQEPELLP
jgi:UDP-N-acetylmuramate dehydrogenase